MCRVKPAGDQPGRAGATAAQWLPSAILGGVIGALTWYVALTAWDMPLAVAVVLVLAAAGYLCAVVRARTWPTGRSACFLAALAVTAIAVGGSVDVYSGVLFSMHMVQHLLLIMVIPALFILGRPLELLRTARGERARRIPARRRIMRVLTHPAVAFPYYAAVVVGTHLTPFQQDALLHPWLHGVEELLYLSSGYLLLLPILGGEGAPRTLSYLMRLVVLLGGMVVDTIVGVILLMTPTEPFPAYAASGRTWGPSPLDDLHLGGAIMWVGGDVLMAALAIIVISQWVNSPGQGNDLGTWLESARRSAVGGADSDLDLDDDEEALRAYNAKLARLADRERHRKRR